MSKLNRTVAVFVVAGMAVALGQHSFNEGLRRDNAALKRAVAELKQSQEIREPIAADESLMSKQLDELLKLRGEVTRLREQTNQIGALVDANQKLLVSLKETKSSPVYIADKKKKPEDALPQDIHPKESSVGAYRGYATPDAAIESMCWAMAKGDKTAFLAALSPEMLAEIQPKVDESDFAKDMASRDMGEFRILDRQTLSDDLIVLTVYSTRKDAEGNNTGNSENTFFKRIDGQWKIADSAVVPK